jgi:hypothetical protein
MAEAFTGGVVKKVDPQVLDDQDPGDPRGLRVAIVAVAFAFRS